METASLAAFEVATGVATDGASLRTDAEAIPAGASLPETVLDGAATADTCCTTSDTVVVTVLAMLSGVITGVAEAADITGEGFEMANVATGTKAGALAATIGVDVSNVAAASGAGVASPDAVWLGSNTKVPAAPIVKLVPAGNALAVVMTSVPVLTAVPPA